MEKILKSRMLAIVKNENDNDATCVKEINGDAINATVPGNFELDIYIKEP